MLDEFLQQHPKLEKWFRKLDCVCFSREVIKGNPEIIKYAEAKFLYSGCGIRSTDGNILVTDINGNGRMRENFEQMLQMVTPAVYAVKGEALSEFFLPFEKEIMTSAHNGHEHLLKLLKDDPKEAALYLLVQTRFSHINIYGKEKISLLARKFDALYEQLQKNIPQ